MNWQVLRGVSCVSFSSFFQGFILVELLISYDCFRLCRFQVSLTLPKCSGANSIGSFVYRCDVIDKVLQARMQAQCLLR